MKTPDADQVLCASLLFENSNHSFNVCLSIARGLSEYEKRELVRSSMKNRNFYDAVDRSFEMIDISLELTVSATNYAQLKRHRMSTQIMQDYSTGLGYTIPQNIIDMGMDNDFLKTMQKTDELYRKLSRDYPIQKNYILTNAHRKKVLFKMNARELYHFISLREDEHAQWDIRNTAESIRVLVSKKAPILSMMLCGKNLFNDKKLEVFS